MSLPSSADNQPQQMPFSFLQARMQVGIASRVADVLERSGSKGLTMFASKLRSGDVAIQENSADPFKLVKKTIQDMIVRLLNEAAEEMEHKEWCEEEQRKSEATLRARQADIAELKSKINTISAQQSQASDELAALEREMRLVEQMVSKASTMRTTEQSASLIAVKEYQDAQSLIGNAMTVLKDFYSEKQGSPQSPDLSAAQGADSSTSSSDATALLQDATATPEIATEAPELYGAYQQSTGAASGILSILELALSDFQKLELESTTQETVAVKEYTDMVNENKVKLAVSAREVAQRQKQKALNAGNLSRMMSELKGYQREIQAVTDYIQELRPSCIYGGETAEERKERREEEIKSLQQALSILKGETI